MQPIGNIRGSRCWKWRKVFGDVLSFSATCQIPARGYHQRNKLAGTSSQSVSRNLFGADAPTISLESQTRSGEPSTVPVMFSVLWCVEQVSS